MIDPLLPDEGDYPTDEIDVWPLLAEGYVVDANGAAHDKRNGRFARKARLTVLRELGTGDNVREVPIRLFTWAEIHDLPPGPEHADAWAERFPEGGPTVFEWPDEPGVEWETETFANGAMTICKRTDQESRHTVERKPRPYCKPEADVLRGWAKRQGYPIKAKGVIPQKYWDMHRAAWEAENAKGVN